MLDCAPAPRRTLPWENFIASFARLSRNLSQSMRVIVVVLETDELFEGRIWSKLRFSSLVV